jgi:hypothetical protein
MQSGRVCCGGDDGGRRDWKASFFWAGRLESQLVAEIFFGKEEEIHPRVSSIVIFIFRRYLNVYECPCLLLHFVRALLSLDQYHFTLRCE